MQSQRTTGAGEPCQLHTSADGVLPFAYSGLLRRGVRERERGEGTRCLGCVDMCIVKVF